MDFIKKILGLVGFAGTAAEGGGLTLPLIGGAVILLGVLGTTIYVEHMNNKVLKSDVTIAKMNEKTAVDANKSLSDTITKDHTTQNQIIDILDKTHTNQDNTNAKFNGIVTAKEKKLQATSGYTAALKMKPSTDQDTASRIQITSVWDAYCQAVTTCNTKQGE